MNKINYGVMYNIPIKKPHTNWRIKDTLRNKVEILILRQAGKNWKNLLTEKKKKKTQSEYVITYTYKDSALNVWIS